MNNLYFNLCFLGSATAVLGLFPSQYLGAMGSGAGIGGLVPSLINLAIIGASENSAKLVGVTCFCISTILALSCCAIMFMLQKNQFYLFYGSSFNYRSKKDTEEVTFILSTSCYFLKLFVESTFHSLTCNIFFVNAMSLNTKCSMLLPLLLENCMHFSI